MTELATKLYEHFLKSGKSTYNFVDCLAVEGITADNTNKILKELEAENKIDTNDTYVTTIIKVL